MATDPKVSRTKFKREVEQLLQDQDRNARMGLWVLKAEYPEVLVAFATPKPAHVLVPFAALVDFTDYDARPLKVTLVHPCTRNVLKFSDVLPQVFPGIQFQSPPRLTRLRVEPNGQWFPDQLLVAYDQDDKAPFLCLQGVRSYHDHPAHTGDSWWLHKKRGEGSLHTILHTLWKYGVRNVTGQNVTIQPVVAGLQVIPEFEQSMVVVPATPQPQDRPTEGATNT